MKVRPKIKDYFKEGTTLEKIARIYNRVPKLFKYVMAADEHIDLIEKELQALESERDKLKEKLNSIPTIDGVKWDVSATVEIISEHYEIQQELKTLKDAVKKLKKESKEWEQKYRDELESHFEDMADGDL